MVGLSKHNPTLPSAGYSYAPGLALGVADLIGQSGRVSIGGDAKQANDHKPIPLLVIFPFIMSHITP